MGIWLLVIGMFLICGSPSASDDSLERAKLYMEACAKQELFASVPPLNFTCENKIAGGYYADIDTGCHIFHLCAPSNLQSLTDHPFCCHPELVFDQRFLVCDRPENVDCPVSYRYYSDQFDGPVKVQQRENEEQQAKNRARQSRGSEEDRNESDSEEIVDGETVDDESSSQLSSNESIENNDQMVENPGKAVTLPPAFRQR
ncbi:chitin-binding type-2 domain-containing protein [Caerostris darwini]|uniref:Chitin-binding type-2 domain-containing protein n=2 Tax=Caerostris TaxID=172845 RepID=A0AAV4UHX4_9ARAC|nr:chitin-binding type-2 domain-containing protein [Caerostris extrusa]GIY57342.1 chitin-binding type-2 domain-containing protein [Caerostris darwini]